MRSIVCLLYLLLDLLLGYRESDSKDIRNYRTNRSLQRGKLVREGRSVMSESHRHRRSIRLRGYDYRQMGAYYVTLCTDRKYPWFGEIVDGVMFASVAGSIVQSIWNNLPSHFPFLELDAFVLMPNHLHGILAISDDLHLSASPANSPASSQFSIIIFINDCGYSNEQNHHKKTVTPISCQFSRHDRLGKLDAHSSRRTRVFLQSDRSSLRFIY